MAPTNLMGFPAKHHLGLSVDMFTGVLSDIPIGFDTLLGSLADNPQYIP